MLTEGVADGERWLDQPEVDELLAAWGLPLVDSLFARGPAAAGRAAAELGGTVVLKARAPGPGAQDRGRRRRARAEGERSVRDAAERMRRRLRRAGTPATGFVVQRQLGGGVEMLCGIASDPALGPLVVCGAGGTLTDLLADVQIRLAPVDRRRGARGWSGRCA